MGILSKSTDDEEEKLRKQNIEKRNRESIDYLSRSGAFRINPNWIRPVEKQAVKESEKPE